MSKANAKAMWRSLFDVRPGERRRTAFMALYLFFVMVAYYILKPVSAAMFLHKLGAKDLPYLYMLTAAVGGVVSYLYTKTAVRSSLANAVTWAMAVAILCLIVLWRVIGLNLSWMLYTFNVWVSLFSIVLVSQGWMVAANVFDTRQAKRLYGLLGLGAVVGSGVGATITRHGVKKSGAPTLVLISAAMVVLAYIAFRLAIRDKRAEVAQAKGAKEQVDFSAREIFHGMVRQRHLRVMIAIILVMFIVDETTDFQFNYVAHAHYPGRDALTAFIAAFYFYMSVVSFLLQFFLTAWMVRRLGVGGTLKIAPSSIAACSVGAALLPGIAPPVITKFLESLNRYTINKTAMELLYLPLPADLRNRTKAFMDIFVDRSGRGLAGVLLAVLVAIGWSNPRIIAAVTVAACGLWFFLARRAEQEYLITVKGRLERRRLDLESTSVRVADPEMIRLLENTALTGQPRQICYALTLLAEVPAHDLSPLLERLVSHNSADVRARVFELAWFVGLDSVLDEALAELHHAARGVQNPALKPAVDCALAFSADPEERAREFLSHPNVLAGEAVLQSLRAYPEFTRKVLTDSWFSRAAHDTDPERRYLAAVAIGVIGEEGAIWLPKLMDDCHLPVIAGACRAAGQLRNRACADALVRNLRDPRLRGVAIDALIAYGGSIVGFLGDVLDDDTYSPTIRRQIPRILKHLTEQSSVDVLLKSITQPDLSVRLAVLKALNTLRERAPHLQYGDIFVTD
jgi:AAA family ATP:ADP antiporter